ncbi:hypothetical protein Cycma_2556 [Cyclobacterium marinum DSM 745]|uniref:Lipoprotein n=1 Tax=Cyclobacterium marinum (strain ATCC 25205 / DSM 745 / LMG 13164 / NCIMB 1802) TaxID=880070 RepID=G0IW75_CYCMS|nr:hypothetical protein Cycma_2556 [Cyclobacterium marinum DSM 745]
MKTLLTILVACAILVLSSCASSKPCPAYAKTGSVEANG